jgi:hypothetical protein
MKLEPAYRMVDDLFHRARFLEQMGCTRHNLDALRTPKPRKCTLIELDYSVIVTADDQQRGSRYALQGCAGKVGASTTRNNSANVFTQGRGSDKSGAGACARSKQT